MSEHEQLERILKSPPLVSSPSLCRFLKYVVEETLAGREAEIKEHHLGVRVFERGDQFNPRLDPIVRVQARNLRMRIARYYDGPGAGDPIRIELPKGTYVPVFHRLISDEPALVEEPRLAMPVSVMPVPPPRSPVAESRAPLPLRFLLAMVVWVVILAGIAVLWLTQTHVAPRRAQVVLPAPDLPAGGQDSLERRIEIALRDRNVPRQRREPREP